MIGGPDGAVFGHVWAMAMATMPVAGRRWVSMTESRNASPRRFVWAMSADLSWAQPWPTSSNIKSSGVRSPDAVTRLA